jgi:chromosome segregation ATPase
VNNEQQTQQADDPSGDGWRDVGPDELLRHGDLFWNVDHWQATQHAGQPAVDERTYRRRIEQQQQPSDSEPETMEQLREQVRDLTRQAQFDAVELQQLREQVQALTLERDEHARKLEFARESGDMSRRQVECEAGKVEQLKQQLWDAVEARQKAERELKDANEAYQLCLQSHYKAGQRSAIDKLQAWLKPVLEVVAENPEDSVALALAVLADMPAIAARLIEE